MMRVVGQVPTIARVRRRQTNNIPVKTYTHTKILPNERQRLTLCYLNGLNHYQREDRKSLTRDLVDLTFLIGCGGIDLIRPHWLLTNITKRPI